MASIDVFIQTLLFYCLMPIVAIIIFIRWYFKEGVLSQRVHAFIQNTFLRRFHRRLAREKHLLFDKLTQMNDQAIITGRIRNTLQATKLLEIGVGSGRNFDFYPKGTILTCLDPNPCYEDYLMKSMQSCSNKFLKLDKFVQGFAEDMSVFNENTFDIVVCTLTLCSVKNQDAVVREVQRVLKPGGTFYFLEHVAAKKGSFGRWLQDKLDVIQPHISEGCHLNRDTGSCFDKSDLFKSVSFRDFSARLFPGASLPCIYGTAVK